MKRCLSIFLSLLLMLTMFPVTANATENSTTECEELIDLACQIFPEYVSKIKNHEISTYALPRNIEQPEIVFSETRAVSEDENIIYTEYSDGAVLLTDLQFNKEVTYVDRQTGAGATVVTVNIKATCNQVSDQYFKLSNVVYTLNGAGYDSIDNPGTASTSTPATNGSGHACNIIGSRTYEPNETASANARLMYHLQFRYHLVADRFYDSYLTLEVGDNSATVTHSSGNS